MDQSELPPERVSFPDWPLAIQGGEDHEDLVAEQYPDTPIA
jgi:hypothetical protein